MRALLPSEWVITEQTPLNGSVRPDAVVTVADPQGSFARLVIEARERLVPRDVATVVGGRLALLRDLDPYASVLVIAPWLSQRTRDLLTESRVGYLDLTGNALVRLDRPATFIRTTGAANDPAPPVRTAGSLRGRAAGRVVRLLADVRPPYTASAIAGACGVSIPYVSRLLSALDDEVLVRRGPRGLVVDVDWANLLRRRAEVYDVFGTNQARGYLSQAGVREVVGRLPGAPGAYRAVTGSYAASRIAPVAAPSQLVLYVDDPARSADELGLLPADTGADVVLLTPYDLVVMDKPQELPQFRAVATTQLVLDCLSGNGRMPAEGEALLAWMADRESLWRLPDIAAAGQRGQVF